MTFKIVNPLKSLSEKKTKIRKKILVWAVAVKVTTKIVRRALNETLTKERIHKVYSYGFSVIARFAIVRPLVKKIMSGFTINKSKASGFQKFGFTMIIGAGMHSIDKQIGDIILSIFSSTIDKKHGFEEEPETDDKTSWVEDFAEKLRSYASDEEYIYDLVQEATPDTDRK